LDIEENDKNAILPARKLYIDVDLESQYGESSRKGRKDIDIELKFYNSNNEEIYRIIIENKIKAGAANESQLSGYYDAVLEDGDFKTSHPKLIVVFLTPDASSKNLDQEFENLQNKVLSERHSAKRIYWHSDDSSKNSIVKILRKILTKELNAEIQPINEYMRQTLKAFICHITKTIAKSKGNGRYNGEDIGDEVDREEIKVEGKSYTVARRDSGQIQLYENDEKIPARPVLRKYIQVNNIPDDGKQNTRQYGKTVLDHLKEQSQSNKR
jgi:hypothetical protein